MPLCASVPVDVPMVPEPQAVCALCVCAWGVAGAHGVAFCSGGPQENMPLEETAWNLLILASIGQRQGGDFSWLEPYWPAVSTW